MKKINRCLVSIVIVFVFMPSRPQVGGQTVTRNTVSIVQREQSRFFALQQAIQNGLIEASKNIVLIKLKIK